MLKSISDLHQLAIKSNRKRMAVVFAHDEHVMEAVSKACAEGLIEPIFIGHKKEIESYIRALNIAKPYQVIDEDDPAKASAIATDLVNQNQCDIVMKGLIDTKIILKAVVNSETGIKNRPLLSHVGVVELPTYHKLIFATDGAMNIKPSVEQKLMLTEAAVELAHTLGYLEPKVGIVSAVEKVNPKILSTVEAKAMVDYYQDKQHDFIIDGPFAIDNLVSLESKRQKNIDSEVAGDCDIFVFPDLESGNIFYKTCMFLAQGHSAGLVLGAKVPIVLTSRADSAESKYHSILLAVVNADGLSDTSH